MAPLLTPARSPARRTRLAQTVGRLEAAGSRHFIDLFDCLLPDGRVAADDPVVTEDAKEFLYFAGLDGSTLNAAGDRLKEKLDKNP